MHIGNKKSSQGSLSPVGIFFYVRKHTYKEHKRQREILCKVTHNFFLTYSPPCAKITRPCAHTCTRPHTRPRAPAHTRPMRDTRKRSRAHALPCACPCASDHTPRNAPVSLPEPPHALFYPSPVSLPSQPVKRLTEPYRRLYSRFPVFRV